MKQNSLRTFVTMGLMTMFAVMMMAACNSNGSKQTSGDTPEAAQPTAAPAVEDSQQQEGVVTFDNGKLGPVTVGQSVGKLPKSTAGLYDKYEYKKEEHEDDMDGSWTEEYYLFTKGGKPVFRVNMDAGKVFSIRLLEGSQFIKTADGIGVGMPVSKLIQKKKLSWETYYEGEVFATSGHYTYYVSSEDVPNTDVPKKASDFKPTAKVSGIVYNK